MRFGFTTGSCAAAAAKAAAYMLLTGEVKERVSIVTPKGIAFDAEILDIVRTRDSVTCGVRKDAGDDPDVTSGCVVRATVTALERGPARVEIDGGEGVGRVTKPGLDQPVGAAAINSAPRAAIEKEALEVADALDFEGTLRVVISVPGGKELAEKTFNPRLGIVGGVSILGTSGIVEPMSVQALIDTVAVELNQQRALGRRRIAIAPGNYGLDFMKARFGFDLDRAVKCSNFFGQAVDLAAEKGFSALLVCGHVGKLVKVAGGIMNTHSRESGARLEIMAASAVACGASLETARAVLGANTTDAALELVEPAGLRAAVMARIAERAAFYLRKRAGEALQIETVVFANKSDAVGATDGARALVDAINEESEDE